MSTEQVQVTIKTLDGAEHVLLHSPPASVSDLVEQVLHCSASQFRLIPSPTARHSFILVPVRHRDTSGASNSAAGPSDDAIAKATSHFTADQSNTTVQPAVMQELETQIRGLLTRMAEPADTAPEPVNEASIQRLQEMGFTREQVIGALQQANGNEMLAASYLLGDTDSDLDEADEPDLQPLQLDPQAIIAALFSNPNFLQGVNDPRVLEALQHIVAEPDALEQYLNDPQLGPLLLLLYNSLAQQ